MGMRFSAHKSLLLLLVLLLVAGTILACDLGGIGKPAAGPSVVIDAPPDNAEVQLGEAVPIRSTATDDAGVTRVELWVDGTLYASEASPIAKGQSPFAVVQRWTADVRGAHEIIVKAYNAAGNVAESAPLLLIVVDRGPEPRPTEPMPEPTQPGPQPTATQPGPQPTQPAPSPTDTPTAPQPTATPTHTPTDTPVAGPCLPTEVTKITLAPAGSHPKGLAGHGHRVYVALHDAPLVLVIDADADVQLPSLNTHASGPKYGNAVGFHDGRVYVSNRDANTVSSINVSDPTDWSAIPTGPQPFGLAAAGQYIYVANFGNNTVGRIDPSTDTYVGSILNISEPALLGSLGQDVFVPTNGPGPVYRIPPSGSPIAVGPDRKSFFAAAANANGRVFVTNRNGLDVTKIDGNTDLVQGTPVDLPHRPYGIAVNQAKNRVYVVAAEADLLYVLDGATLQIVGTVPVGVQGAMEGGQGIAALGNKIYVSNYQDGSVTVLDDSACP